MSGKNTSSNSGGSKGARRSNVKTPAKGNRRPPAKASKEPKLGARDVVRGREVEFWGVGLISTAIVLVLSIYVKMAGPVGEGIDTVFGWLLGLGRFALPVVIAGVGVAMVRRRSIEHRLRLAIGWVVVVSPILGVLHVINGADSIVADVDAMSNAGGWIGALLGEPLRSTLSWAGALVVLGAIGLAGAMLVTDTTVPELIEVVRKRTGVLGSSASGFFRSVKSSREKTTHYDNLINVSDDSKNPQMLAKPSIYDAGEDEDLASRPSKSSRPTKSKPTSAQRSEFDEKTKTENANDQSEPAVARTPGSWTLPPHNLLSQTQVFQVDKARVAQRGQLLEEALASHGVDTRLVEMTVGPTVTRFELELGAGVKVAKVTSLNRDIAYAMAATDVRILAPIPGKSAVGVEVPNETRQLVSLGDLMGSDEAVAATHPLDVAVGKDIAGRAVFVNLAATPHMLIAGATGAGKSSGINSILTSLLMRSTPDEVRLILIDPKQVEMGQYARLPHLLTAPVTNPKKAANALGWAVKEMERRYDLLVEVGFRDIGGYNAAFDRGEVNDPDAPEGTKIYDRLAFIVVVVDELNDLMMVAARDVEECITRIAQKARAVGIHLIVATQRPSVNVITGVIKANIPARMAFAVSSLTDSRVILDQPGAEKLVGKGDMLLMPGNTNVPQRIQGSWVDEEEVRKVVAHWRRQSPEVVYISGIEGQEQSSGGSVGTFGGGNGQDDDLIRTAIEVVVRSGVGSTSLLQRKLKVGFARAGRIMDELEERGIVGPSEGSKARTVLMSVEELEAQGG